MTSNDAFVAALGLDAVAAVRGYRLQVISEAARRGLRLVTVSPSELVLASPDSHLVIDPIEIRLTILPSRGWDDLAGRMLSWNPAHGWAVCPSTARPPFAYYAHAGGRPIDLVPTPALVLDWATSGFPGRAISPAGIGLDSDREALQRLLGFVDSKYRTFLNEAFAHCAPVQIRARLLHRSPLTDGGLIRSDLIVDLDGGPRTPPEVRKEEESDPHAGGTEDPRRDRG